MNEIKTIKAEHVEIGHDADGMQTIALPVGFELPEGPVSIRKDGVVLIIESTLSEKPKPQTWAELFDQMETIDVEWPDLDEGLLPLDDIDL